MALRARGLRGRGGGGGVAGGRERGGPLERRLVALPRLGSCVEVAVDRIGGDGVCCRLMEERREGELRERGEDERGRRGRSRSRSEEREERQQQRCCCCRLSRGSRPASLASTSIASSSFGASGCCSCFCCCFFCCCCSCCCCSALAAERGVPELRAAGAAAAAEVLLLFLLLLSRSGAAEPGLPPREAERARGEGSVRASPAAAAAAAWRGGSAARCCWDEEGAPVVFVGTVGKRERGRGREGESSSLPRSIDASSLSFFLSFLYLSLLFLFSLTRATFATRIGQPRGASLARRGDRRCGSTGGIAAEPAADALRSAASSSSRRIVDGASSPSSRCSAAAPRGPRRSFGRVASVARL